MVSFMLLHRLPAEILSAPGVSASRPYFGFLARRRLPLRRWLLPLVAAEAAVAAGVPAALVASFLADTPYRVAQVAAAFLVSLALWLFSAQSQNLYRPISLASTFAVGLATATACLLWLAGVMLMLFVAHPDFPATHAVAAAMSAMLAIMALRLSWRRLLQSALRHGGCLERALLLAGSSAVARDEAARVENATGGMIRVVGSIAMPGSAGAPSMAWVEDAIDGDIADRILIAGFEHFPAALDTVLPRLAALDVDVALLGDEAALRRTRCATVRIGTLSAIQLAVPPLGRLQLVAKRTSDIAVAATALLLLAPLLLPVAAAIRIESKGPVFFAQRRVGFRGNIFKLLKFRTMYCEMTDEAALRQTSRDDARITRVGRVLRRLSIDEIPQLLNVLRGEMSIVGPRPHAIGMTVCGQMLDAVIAAYPYRHRVRPGITGWAQVNACRGEVTSAGKLQRRLALDCEYIERWSLALDVWIMLRTVAVLLFDRHAY